MYNFYLCSYPTERLPLSFSRPVIYRSIQCRSTPGVAPEFEASNCALKDQRRRVILLRRRQREHGPARDLLRIVINAQKASALARRKCHGEAIKRVREPLA